MTTSTTPKNEERAARDRLKAIERARAANAKATARRRADVIRDELDRSPLRVRSSGSPPSRSSRSCIFNRGESKEQTARRYIDMTR
jgi:hypothetical protein